MFGSDLHIGNCTVFCLIWRKQKPDEFPLALDWCLLHVHEGGGSYRGVPEGTGFPMHNVNFGLKITYVEIKFATHNFDRKLVMVREYLGMSTEELSGTA